MIVDTSTKQTRMKIFREFQVETVKEKKVRNTLRKTQQV